MPKKARISRETSKISTCTDDFLCVEPAANVGAALLKELHDVNDQNARRDDQQIARRQAERQNFCAAIPRNSGAIPWFSAEKIQLSGAARA